MFVGRDVGCYMCWFATWGVPCYSTIKKILKLSCEKHAPRGHQRLNPWPPASRLRPLITPPASCLCPNKIFVLAILCPSNFEMSIRDPKRIQMKKLSTTKFYNFLRSTTFILVVSPSEVVCKIWISNLRNSNVVFHDKMISNEKVVNYKVS